jgi:hypothetical protein
MNLKSSLCDRVVALRNSVLILPVFLALFSSSCVKDSTLIGVDFIPQPDKIQTFYTDTITVYSSLTKLDRVASYGIVDFIFGSYQDPIFGQSTANVITEFSWPYAGYVYGPNPVADSVTMTIRYKYKYVYGNKNTTINFKVYALLPTLLNKDTANLYPDTVSYYSDLDVQPFLGPQIGQFSFRPSSSPSDSLIKFYLDPAFGNRLIQDTSKYTYKLIHYFHKNINSGIAIIPDKITTPGDGFIFKTYFNADYMWIDVYYKDDSLIINRPGIDSVSHFAVSATNHDVRLNTYSNDYSASAFLASLNTPTIHDSMNYIASMGGVMTKLSFPGLDNLKTKPTDIISVNRAELILPVFPGDTVHYPPSEMIQLLHQESNGSYSVLPDYTYFSAYNSYIDGNYDLYNRLYSTQITKHIEYCFTHKDYGKDLFVRSTTSSSSSYPEFIFAGRSILLNGTGKNKIKLKVTYTKR